MCDVDALQLDLALSADRNRVHHGTDRRHSIGFRASLLEGYRPRGAARQRLAPTRHVRSNVERADHVVLIRQAGAGDELAPIAVRVLACGMSELVHEALAIVLVCGLSYAAPRADGNVEFRRVVREA